MNFKEAFSVKGYDQMDIFYEEAEAKGLVIDANNIKNFNSVFNSGFGVRVVVKDKVGFAYGNDLRKLKEVAEQAVKVAKFSNTKVNLEKFSKYPEVKGLFDKKLEEVNEDLLIELTKQGLDSAKDKGCYTNSGGVSASISKNIYVNSEGLELEEKDSAYLNEIEVKFKDSQGFWEVESNSFSDNYIDTVTKACDMAKQNSVKGEVKTCKCDVIIHPFACDMIFSSGIYPLFNSDYVQKGRSAYKDRIGEQIVSDKLTIFDNGVLDGGLNSSSFDGDGVPCQKTPLVDKGVLKNFIYDLTRAQKEGRKSTGNASRSYNALPGVGISNFQVVPGAKNLLKEIDKGLVVYMPLNAHAIDFVAGDFSLGVGVGFWIEKEEIKFAPKNAMISGNIREFLKSVEVSNDVINFGNYVGPSLLGKMNVTGE